MADPLTIALMVGSTLLKASAEAEAGQAAMSEGMARQEAAAFEAKQMKVKAGQERAAAIQRMVSTRKQERLIQSKIQAQAAASGAGTTDPSILRLTGDIAKEGEYRALTDLYIGEERARGLEAGAAVRTFEGEQAYRAGKTRQRAGFMRATGTLLSGGTQAASLYSKYNEPTGGEAELVGGFDTPGIDEYGYG